MFYQYLTIAYRNLSRQKLVSFINIFGLGMAMSVALLQGVILQHEMDYDRFHPNASRTYRVLSDIREPNGNNYVLASSPLPLSTSLAADTGKIEAALVIQPFSTANFQLGNKEASFQGAYVHGDFFTVFGFRLQKGNPATALSAPGNIVLSAQAAKRFFGDDEPIGKTIQFPGQQTVLVSGVLQHPPGKSHLDLDGYVYTATPDTGSWFNAQKAYTYLLLRESARKKDVDFRLSELSGELNQRSAGIRFAFEMQALRDIRPADRQLYNDIGGGTSWTKLQTGITVSLIILVAACFNYINLAIARAMAKAKEVGVRKIIGAKRRQIFAQYLVDALLSTSMALIFAWFLLTLIVSYAPFNDDYEFIPSAWNYNTYFVLGSMLFAAFTALLAGVIPALMLSAFDPLKVLKNLRSVKIFGKMGLQKSLIVFQYSFSLIVLIFLTTFFRQFNFLGKQDMHFNQENLLVIDLQGMDGQIVAQQLEKIAGVDTLSAASSLFNPHYNGRHTTIQSKLPDIDRQLMNTVICQPEFLAQLNLQWIAGKNLPVANQNGTYLVVNESAARRLGFQQPEKAAGATVIVEDTVTCTITGIVRDFSYEKSGKRIDPLLFRTGKSYAQLFVSADPENALETTRRIMAAWPATGSKQPARVSRLADEISRNNSQKGTLSILAYLSFIALSIASLGLLGLVIFSVESRRKELGIRKIIGASRLELTRLISMGFIKLLLISGAISIPIGYLVSFLFLQNFLERVGFIFVFTLACFAAMFGIGLFTIGSQVLTATAQNPVHALRED